MYNLRAMVVVMIVVVVVVMVLGWGAWLKTVLSVLDGYYKTSKNCKGFTWLRVESGGTFRQPSRQVELIRKFHLSLRCLKPCFEPGNLSHIESRLV
jgi:Tfp pilus assembly protein PilO